MASELRMCLNRLTEKEGEDGMMASAVRPYVMDLGSTNGTFLNNERLEAQRFYELYEKVGNRLFQPRHSDPCAAACLDSARLEVLMETAGGMQKKSAGACCWACAA